MILVTVGTQKQQFNRIFELVAKSKCFRKQEIIAQVGYTKYENKRMNIVEFLPLDKMDKYIEESDIIISHGGVGTIFSAIKKGKKVIAVPRLAKYGEHINDHQIEICEELEKEGYILYYKDGIDNFDDVVKKIKNTSLKEYNSDNDYIEILRKEI